MNSFDKIIGYESEKAEMLRLCDVLKNGEKYARLGIKTPKAILLYGEPGLGKSLMAKAFIAETGRKIFACKKNKSDGEFVNEIKTTFESAVKEAPSIIFFDDMDKFAEDNLRQDNNKEEFATIQSGLEDNGESDVFVIATANDINNLPESLLRAGRFGKKIQFHTPLFEDSVKIIRYYLASKSVSPDVKAESLARILSGSSCAMLETVINEAGIYAAYENADKITLNHIRNAVATVMLERAPMPISDEYKWQIAYHEAGLAVLNLLFKYDIGCVAIGRKCDKTGQSAGVCMVKSHYLDTEQDVRIHLMILLAGKASSELQFGRIDVGVDSDVEEAMITIRQTMQLSLLYGFEYCYTTDRYYESQSYRQIDKNQEKAVQMLERYYNEAKELLQKHKPLLDVLARELHEKEILIYDDIKRIADGFALA